MTRPQIELKRPVDIDMYSDFLCPWCYIGAERVVQILEGYSFTQPVRVHHRVYLLSPDLGEEGVNIAEDLRRKYGRDPAEMFARVEQAAHAGGLPLDLTKMERRYPSVRAHALTLHAAAKGNQDLFKRALYRASFVEARNIHDVDVLVEIATQYGFTEPEVRDIAASRAEHDAVMRQAMQAFSVARTGVPFFIFNEARAVSGAQPEEVLVDEIRRAGNPVG